ncbi:MAG TPA: SDR family NAD(P)-dependent oxidoreductase [Acidimicrobiia bacterium]|jgi:NAD(P)-dependent dehydrogenase (short-subunit alcohol dehydrogenase family)
MTSTWFEDPTDKVAVVTGGAGGIGQAMAARFLAAGMNVVIADVEEAANTSALDSLDGGDRAFAITCDVRSLEDTERLRDQTLARFGAVHVVCLNAGVAPVGPMLETPVEVWDWVFDVNVRGVVHGALAFAPLLAEQEAGHFVCTASIAGVTDTPTLPPYGVSKHAVVGLAASMRRELAERGVGVSVLCPGLINTKIFESERNRPTGMDDPSDDNPTSKAYRDMIVDGAPPSQVAEVVFQAIVDNQFFVFPTRDLDALVEARIADIRQGFEWRDTRFPEK